MKEYYPEGQLLNTINNKRNMLNANSLNAAFLNEEILEGCVLLCDSDHNLIVDMGVMRGIIPREEGAIGIREGITRDIALISRVGRAVSFVITGFNYDENGVMYAEISRRKAQERCRQHILENKIIGDIIDARITHLESFGAFCDIGCGNIALMPIDAISVSRISHPKDRFCVGDDIKAIIKNIDDENKITLSHKELLGTWEENAALFSQGQTVSGIVRSIEDYGIFVELTPNLAGLAEPRDDVRVGQTASVYIKSIIPEKMKIKLIIIDSFDRQLKGRTDYFYNEEHIDSFTYSPPYCCKNITTVF